MAEHASDEFMSRVMSNLDGNKDAKIASLVAALRACAAATMPGDARRIALEAIRGHVGARNTRAAASQSADSGSVQPDGSK